LNQFDQLHQSWSECWRRESLLLLKVQPGTGRYQEERKEQQETEKEDCGKKEKIEDFSSTDPYKMKMMGGGEGGGEAEGEGEDMY
jgi:hypothetical protein